MTVDLHDAKGGTLIHEGREYGFCSARCRDECSSGPATFLEPGAPAPTAAPGTNGPADAPPGGGRRAGRLPDLRHALEPLAVSVEEEDNPELRDMLRSSGWGWS